MEVHLFRLASTVDRKIPMSNVTNQQPRSRIVSNKSDIRQNLPPINIRSFRRQLWSVSTCPRFSMLVVATLIREVPLRPHRKFMFEKSGQEISCITSSVKSLPTLPKTQFEGPGSVTSVACEKNFDSALRKYLLYVSAVFSLRGVKSSPAFKSSPVDRLMATIS